MRNILRIALITVVLSGFSSKVEAQIDSVFWFAAPWVTPSHANNVPIALRISTFDAPTTVRVYQPAGTYDSTFVVPANSLNSHFLSPIVNTLESKPADNALNYGLKIEADTLITVVYEVVTNVNNPETYSLKGQNAVGTEFVCPFQTTWNNGNYAPIQPKSMICIVATEDNTTVWITPKTAVVGHPANVTYSITLMEGQTYTVENLTQATSTPGNNLAGTIVYSDKPIAVTVSDDSVTNSGGGCRDLMGDQIVPVDVVGTNYIVNRGNMFTNSQEGIFIVATENFTTVSVTTVLGTFTQLLNQGETWKYVLTATETLAFVDSDKNVYVLQASGFGCEVGEALLPPINCAGSDQVSFTRTNSETFILNILCPTSAINDFLLNGSNALVPGSSFNPVPGTGGAWSGAQITFSTANIPVGSSNILTNSSELFAMGVINGGAGSGCYYHYMSSFLRRVITDAGVDVTVCNGEPQIDLLGSVSGGTTTGIWTVLNGTGTLNTPTSLTTTYVPSASDYAQGELTFVLSSTGNCDPKTDTMSVTFIQSPVVDAGENQSYCKNNVGSIPLNGFVNFAAGASWTGGPGGAFDNPGSLNANYTPSPADLANDSVVLYLTSSGSLFACPDDVDSLIVFFTPQPTVNAGANLVLCASSNTVNLNGSISGATTTGIWSTSGTGAFSPSDVVTNGTYNISSGDTLAGSIILTLTSTNNGACLAEQDQFQVTFLAPPTVQITSNDSICSNLSFFDLDGFVSFGYSSEWTSTGFGSITSPNSIPTQHTITSVDTTIGYIDVFLSTTPGICPVEYDSVRVYFLDPPVVFAGLDDQSCDNSYIQLDGSISGFSSAGTWTSMGTGSFVGSPNNLSTIYNPSAADIGNGSVTFILTSDAVLGGCPPTNDNVTFTFLQAPNAAFNATTACAGSNTAFTDNSTTSAGSINSWEWNFGDQTSSITQNPNHPYSSAGTFNATLIVGSSNGCYDTITQVVNVNPVPVANFSPSVGCQNMPITFSDLSFISSGSISSWNYDFGTSSSSLPNPTFVYNTPGTQSVTLTVTSNLGCTDDTTMSVLINPAPQAEFTYSPNPAMVGENVFFTDFSVGLNINQWYWEFGDGEANNVENPIHNYDIGGSYDIMLAITDGNGCVDTIVKNISVALPPVLPSGFSPNGDGENDVFIIRGGPFNDVDFKVYNNWGEVVFSTTDANEGWDGNYLGEQAPLGVYTWTFVVTLANDVVVKESGDVTLIR